MQILQINQAWEEDRCFQSIFQKFDFIPSPKINKTIGFRGF